jgi:hypothetical protein
MNYLMRCCPQGSPDDDSGAFLRHHSSNGARVEFTMKPDEAIQYPEMADVFDAADNLNLWDRFRVDAVPIGDDT